jgi:soluble lytic murein transglycosylase
MTHRIYAGNFGSIKPETLNGTQWRKRGYFLSVLCVLFWFSTVVGEELEPGQVRDEPWGAAEHAESKGWFIKGVSALQENRFEESIHFFENSLKFTIGWEEYTYYFLLESQWKSGHLAETLGLCKAFENHFPESPLLDRVKNIEAQGYQKSSANWLACRTYEDLLKRQDTADTRLRYGEMLEVLDRLPDAYANYQTVRKKWPRSSAARVAGKRAKLILKKKPELGPDKGNSYDLLNEANLCLRERNYKEALSHYRRILSLRPPSSVRRKVLRGQVICLVKTGKLDSAHGVLRTIMKAYPGSTEEIEGLLAVGRQYWRGNRNQAAYPLLRRLLETYTDTEEAMRASYIMGRILFEEGNRDGAILQFRRTRFLYPETEWEREAAWHEAWHYYLKGDYLSCAEHLKECEADRVWIPELLPRARYWRARCLERVGREAQGRSLYRLTHEKHPGSFYSLLAERRIRGGSLLGEFSPGNEVPSGEGKDPWEEEVFQKLADPALPLLLEAGLNQEAVTRLNWLRQGPEGEVMDEEDWVEAYSLAGNYHKAIRLAYRNGLAARAFEEGSFENSEENLRLLRLLYPLPYWNLIQEEARKNKLDPFLVAGLIRQESMFMADAVSPAGAVGLMQIMPATGKSVARQIGMKGFKTSRLQDPEINIRIGTAYLAQLVKKYGNDWHKILANYNAGPRAVARWTARMPRGDVDEYVESISYRETRLYVKKVLYNGALYQKIYRSLPQAKNAS